MATVIDLQQIIKGKSLNQGRAFISALGVDPVVSSQLTLYSDKALTSQIIGPFNLNQDGWIIDSNTGLSYLTVYVNENSYSIQLLDSDGVSIYDPYRQVEDKPADVISSIDVSNTTFTPSAVNVGEWNRVITATTCTITIESNALAGTQANDILYFRQSNTGTIALVAGSGVTLNGNLTTASQYEAKALIQVAENVWDIVGL